MSRSGETDDSMRGVLAELVGDLGPRTQTTGPADPALDLEAGAELGAYRIIEPLGRGGMGAVYRARDTRLERDVAVKLLGGTLGGEPFVEAQALARLSHRNVVAVHDVGRYQDRTFIAMELIDGTTLRHWLRDRPRSVREIARVFREAGRGLEAAHAAGLVHRDFKPDNVLIGRDGRVCVADFGLALLAGADQPAKVFGTPAYMAPEQLSNGTITPATDQFAFCTSLWEALHGERPPARTRRVPRGIRRALDRGREVDPAKRFADMGALLDALEPPRRTMWIAGGVALAAAGVAVFALRGRTDACAGTDAPIDTVWNPTRHADVVNAFAAKGAPAVGETVASLLDTRARAWRTMRRDSCEATRVRDDQPADVLATRLRCLDRSLASMTAAIDLLVAKPDVLLVVHGADVARSGVSPDECTRTGAARFASATAAPLADAAYADVARAVADKDAGRFPAVVARRAALEARVEAIADPALQSVWWCTLGEALNSIGDAATTLTAFRRCAQAATAAGNDTTAAFAWSQLAFHVARGGDVKAADDLLAAADGAAKRSGDARAEIYALQAHSNVAYDKGDFKVAVASAEQARDRALQLHDDMLASEEYSVIGDAKLGAGDAAGARAANVKALELSERARGLDHPSTLVHVHHLALATEVAGDVAAAKPLWDRAIAGEERVFGPTSLPVMRLLIDLAMAESPGGEHSTPAALAAMQRAVAIGEQALPPKDTQRAQLYESLAFVQQASQKMDDALATYRRAIAFYDTLDDPLGLARVLYDYADTLKETGHCDEALPHFRRVVTVSTKTGQHSKMQAISLGAIGTCLGRGGKLAEAESQLRESVAMLDEVGDVIFAAQYRWELAVVLLHSGKRDAATRIAQQGIDQLAGRPSPAPELSKQIADWLAHPK